MPKPASGQPHWEALAVKLPPALMAAVRRYSDLHRISISELIRQSLAMRLQGTPAPSGARPGTESRLAHLLRHALLLVEDAGAPPACPPYDATKYQLGPLCSQGHAWGQTGQSLRRKTPKGRGYCLACNHGSGYSAALLTYAGDEEPKTADWPRASPSLD
jgi:hypothetical protein